MTAFLWRVIPASICMGQVANANVPRPFRVAQSPAAGEFPEGKLHYQIVMLFHQTIPEPILAGAVGRTHLDRAQVDFQTRGWNNYHP